MISFASLTGCGGGGGGGGGGSSSSNGGANSNTPPVVTTLSSQNLSLVNPKYLTASGANLYLTDFVGKVWTIPTNGSASSSVAATPNVLGITGITLSGTHYIYFSNADNVFNLGNPTSNLITDTNTNFNGITSSGNLLYAANAANILVYNMNNPFPTSAPLLFNGNPLNMGSNVLSLAVSGGHLYATLENSTLARVTLSSGTKEVLTLNGASLNNPNGIVINDGYAYIVNSDIPSGSNGYISRTNLSTNQTVVLVNASTGVWQTNGTGFCGPVGVAMDGTNLYVSNGNCPVGDAGYSNRNSILKIAL